MPSPHPSHSNCALRALTLCDGQQLEQTDYALTTCLCLLEDQFRSQGFPPLARMAAVLREELIDETKPRRS